MTFWVYDRWGNQTGTIADVTEAVHVDELNGEDTLTIVTPRCEVTKGDRIVWRDGWGTWHEHAVAQIGTVHAQGIVQDTVRCENSMSELHLDHIDDLRPYDVTARVALQRALSVTRWEVGTVTVTASASANFYHVSAFEAVREVLQAWGGEFSTTIEVGASGVTARRVNILQRRGEDRGRMFTYTRDITALSRTVVQDDVYTAMYGYGAGLENVDEATGEWSGGYERKLTFGEINDGKDYVEDAEALARWGIPDGQGGVKHAFGRVEFPDCEDMEELLALTTDYLQTVNAPRVEYVLEAVNLADAGFTADDVRTGDVVTIRDKELGERLAGRVLSVERHLVDGRSTIVKVGNIARSMAGLMGTQAADMKWMKDHSASWDAAAVNTGTYLDRLMTRVNDQMNTSGGYTYWEQGEGLITYDKPKDQNPTKAIQITGAGFRIANSKNTDGTWNWRTFGTADGFSADEITSGTLSTILLESLDGLNWWNLSTGEAHFEAANITIGSSPAASQANITASIDALKSLIADASGWSQIEQTAGGLYAIAESAETAASTAQQAAEAAEAKAGAKQATSSTAAATAAKTATCAGFVLSAGVTVSVLFEHASTAAAPTLNVAGTGAKAVWVNGAPASAANPLLWTDGALVTLRYDGTRWRVVDVPGMQSAISSTAAATAAKVTGGTSSPEGYVIMNGTVLDVQFDEGNTATVPTLDVAGTGAATLWANGAPAAASNPITWIDGGMVRFTRVGATWAVTDLLSSSYMRQYAGGVLVGRPGTDIAALVNANGSFDVVRVTWVDGTPTPGNALAILSRAGIGFYDGNGGTLSQMTDGLTNFGDLAEVHTEVAREEMVKPSPSGLLYDYTTRAILRFVDGLNSSTMVEAVSETGAQYGTDERSLTVYDAAGNAVLSIDLELPGTDSTETAALTIGTTADVVLTQAAKWLAAIGAAAASHTHAAGDIASGTLAIARIPTVTVAKGGTGATNAADALSNLGAAAASHTHAAADIASGTLDAARIPSLAASKIGSGTLGVARGGTGAGTFAAGSYLLGNGTSAFSTKTPAQVLADIGAAAASHTHSAYVAVAGDTMTGELVMNAKHERMKSSNIDPDTTPTSSVWANSRLILTNKDGGINGQILLFHDTSGRLGIMLYAQRDVGGTTKSNNLQILVDKSGNPFISVSNATPWRRALGLGTSGALPITVAQGGTGATNAADALANLGAAAEDHTHSIYFSSQIDRTANTVLAAPNGSSGHALFRKLVAADLPTVTVAKGGTGGTTAATARTNLGIAPTQLYSNAGASGTVTLSASVEDFARIKVFYSDNNGVKAGCFELYNPAIGDKFDLYAFEAASTTTTFIRRTRYTVGTTGKTLVPSNGGIVGIVHSTNTLANCTTTNVNNLRITRVEGYAW